MEIVILAHLSGKEKSRQMATKQKGLSNKNVTQDTYIQWYELMQLIRDFEFNAYRLVGQQKISGFCHVYSGEEAVVAGSMSAIEKDDKTITAYRDHGHALAVGIDPKYVMAELFGKIDGCTKGKGGSMHMFSKDLNFFGGHGIVGGCIPLGTGIGFAEKYKESGNICVTFFGDGAVLQGSFHESLNLAMTWKLPIVYVIENNQYGMGTSIDRVTNVPELYKKACEFDMPAEQVDGMNPYEVHKAMEKAANRARKESTPTLLEMQTYRYRGHSISDPATYRTKDEVEHYKGLDPIEQALDVIRKKKYMNEEEIKEVKDRVKQRVQDAIQFADEADFPDPSELYKDVYMQDDYPYLVD